jgi:hypothetical protein
MLMKAPGYVRDVDTRLRGMRGIRYNDGRRKSKP